jgi:hypothetical protein
MTDLSWLKDTAAYALRNSGISQRQSYAIRIASLKILAAPASRRWRWESLRHLSIQDKFKSW